MAVNDFWRRLAGDNLAPGERYVSPSLLETALLDIATGDAGGITLAQTRTAFELAVGTDAGTEFTDLITSLQSIPGTAGLSGTKLILQERILNRIIRFAILGGRQSRITANPYDTASELRLRVRGLITAAGGTPAGTLAA